jgi:AraC-like DNA-binding protein
MHSLTRPMLGAKFVIDRANCKAMRQTAAHYPEIDQPVIAMAKAFAAGSRTGWHCHRRAQLIFALRGLMVASTDSATWLVPAGYALWMPADVRHDVAMRGDVDMRTVYVDGAATAALPQECCVLRVSELLQAALVALTAEPIRYDRNSRGGHLAAILLDEVARAPSPPFALVIPGDRRLARLAHALIEDPGSSSTIDIWAMKAGVSRRTLTRLFRKQTGLSFGAWRRRLRLREAAAREAEGEPLHRVVAALGYTSVAAFRAMARRELGTAGSSR